MSLTEVRAKVMSMGTTISFPSFESLARPVWKDTKHHRAKLTAQTKIFAVNTKFTRE